MDSRSSAAIGAGLLGSVPASAAAGAAARRCTRTRAAVRPLQGRRWPGSARHFQAPRVAGPLLD